MQQQKRYQDDGRQQSRIEAETIGNIAPQQGNNCALHPASGTLNPEHRPGKTGQLLFFEPIGYSRMKKRNLQQTDI